MTAHHPLLPFTGEPNGALGSDGAARRPSNLIGGSLTRISLAATPSTFASTVRASTPCRTRGFDQSEFQSSIQDLIPRFETS